MEIFFSKARSKRLAQGMFLIVMMGFLSWFGVGASALEVGGEVPDVSAVVTSGEKIALREVIKGEGYTLVYFYPKADTPGCTAQACSLRDSYEVLQKKGVKVIGVSIDKVEAQKAFKEKYNLPFELISDPEGAVVKAFDVPTVPVAGFSKRQAYLFKGDRLVWRDLSASTKEQANDILKVLAEETKQ